MQLAIVQNPHTQKPDELWKLFEDESPNERSIEPDFAGLDRLKQTMAKGSKIKVN